MVKFNGEFRVLLVDDDLEDLLLFKKSLEENTDFPAHIEAARTFEEALAKLQKEHFHVILADSQLQDDGAFALLRSLQEASIRLPFILMTPVRDDTMAREAIKQGVAEVIIKSESQFSQLAEKLRQSYEKFHVNDPEDSASVVEPPARRESDIPGAVVEPVEREDVNIRDSLTGVFTHGYLHQRIVGEFSRANRYNYPLSCLMVDLDHFKTINEEESYKAGDELLRQSAQLLFDSCRLSDVVARYGGSQFLVLLPHISYQGAFQVAKRLRVAFSEHTFRVDQSEIHMTVSIGVSSFPEDSMSCRADMITFAQRALLNAKASGRNRCVLFRDVEPLVTTRLPKIEIKDDDLVRFQRRLTEVAESARRDYIAVSRELLQAMESKDKFTAGHGAHSAKYARQVANAMGLSAEEAEIIEYGTLLHDIGKICIPDSILLKEGKLTFAEFEMMKQHTYFGYKILKPIKFLREESLIVLHHHEWFNGEGYPCHLRGEEIPLGARICAAIDAYDTMRQAGGRYKKTVTAKEALEELVNLAGLQFDPEVVRIFSEVLFKRGEVTEKDFDRELLDKRLRHATLKSSSK